MENMLHISQLFSATSTKVMGILNVTPDSFSDGGQWANPQTAINHALEMQAQGAQILDIGGESTRPGAQKITPAQEQARILPVIRGYLQASENPLPISVDTRHAQTARRAVEAGASMVNDISGGNHDPEMYSTVADLQVPYICQHLRGTPQTMDQCTDYGPDPVGTIIAELEQRLENLQKNGVCADHIVLDPGLGFAKTHRQSWQILAELDRFQALGYPLLIGQSRKRFLSLALAPTEQEKPAKIRDGATTAVTTLCAQAKVWAVRVHNVADSVAAVNAVNYCQKG